MTHPLVLITCVQHAVLTDGIQLIICAKVKSEQRLTKLISFTPVEYLPQFRVDNLNIIATMGKGNTHNRHNRKEFQAP